ncbi:hypothetical protein AVEN_93691-1 [Araneus ventricosus]|uniref:Uncharacterized protein n=1 Tax=Araneus ventricosus TaxID=182803 RepID=A0A4Y2NS97_ARAVE|nr:hypothetical protein AVEN_93691-1 [Araneus ventricosus]
MMTMSPAQEPLSADFHSITAGMHLTLEVRFNVHQAQIHGGSLVVSDFKPGILRFQNRNLITRPPPFLPDLGMQFKQHFIEDLAAGAVVQSY